MVAEADRQRRVPGPAALPDLVASFFTLSGAGFVEAPRNSFIERCEAAAAAGFAGLGLHADDLRRSGRRRSRRRRDARRAPDQRAEGGRDRIPRRLGLPVGRPRPDRAYPGRHRKCGRRVRRPQRQHRRIQRGCHPRQRRGAHHGSHGPPRKRGPAGAARTARRPRIIPVVGDHQHQHRHRPAPPRRRPERGTTDRRLALLQRRRPTGPAPRSPDGRHHRRPTQRRPTGPRRLPAARPRPTPATRPRRTRRRRPHPRRPTHRLHRPLLRRGQHPRIPQPARRRSRPG